MGTGSVSWFEVNGYGCKPTYPINITSEDPYRPVRPEHVNDCLIDYPIVEVIHSGIQFALSVSISCYQIKISLNVFVFSIEFIYYFKLFCFLFHYF